MHGDLLLERLHERLASTDARAVLAEDPRLANLVAACVRQAQELVERRCMLEAQVWLAGTIAIVERRQRKRAAASRRQEERIATLVKALGNDAPSKDLARLLSRAAIVQPETTGRLLDVVDSALRAAE